LAVLDFDDFFGRHQDLAELVLHAGALDALGQRAHDALFHAGIGMHDVPALVAHWNAQRCASVFSRDFARHRIAAASSCTFSLIIVSSPVSRRTTGIPADLIRAPQENRHDQHKGKHDAGDLGRFACA
jgi:hypothetical protein